MKNYAKRACVAIAFVLCCCSGSRTPGFPVLSIPAAHERLAQTSQPPIIYLNGWAGYILVPNPQTPAIRFSTIEGEWVVPNALPTINCDFKKIQEDGSSLWIGMDGWSQTNDNDVLQAGTETAVHCWDGKGNPPRAAANFWIEWDGLKNIPVTKKHLMDLPIRIGDRVGVRIVADTSGPDAWQAATAYFQNLSTHKEFATHFHSGCIVEAKPPYKCTRQDATLYGNAAEWVTEITFNNSGSGTRTWPNTLDDFGTVQMSTISVTDSNGNAYTPLSPGNTQQTLDWMSIHGNGTGTLGPKDTLLACAAISNGNDVVYSRAPYKLASPWDIGKLEPKPTNCSGTIQPPPP
jgi:hypothetical protein